MTKKDYVAIAQIISQNWHVQDAGLECLDPYDIVDDFVWLCKEQNPLFDEDKFRTACSPG